MAWVRLDDGYPEHPKVDRVGPLAAWLNVCAWAYCARNLTDGFVPEGRVERLAQVKSAKALAGLLVEVNLWEVVDGGYQVHDYLAYNPSRETVLKDRAATSKRVAEWRENHVTTGVSNGVTGLVSNGVSPDVANGVSTPPPVPGPARPKIHPDKFSPSAATQQSPPSFSPTEQSAMLAITAPLSEFNFRLDPGLWRKVFDSYSALDLETEAFKQADWLKRRHVKTCSASRYTNWLSKALADRIAHEPIGITPPAIPTDPVCRCDEVRASLASDARAYPFCGIHGRVQAA